MIVQFDNMFNIVADCRDDYYSLLSSGDVRKISYVEKSENVYTLSTNMFSTVLPENMQVLTVNGFKTVRELRYGDLLAVVKKWSPPIFYYSTYERGFIDGLCSCSGFRNGRRCRLYVAPECIADVLYDVLHVPKKLRVVKCNMILDSDFCNKIPNGLHFYCDDYCLGFAHAVICLLLRCRRSRVFLQLFREGKRRIRLVLYWLMKRVGVSCYMSENAIELVGRDAESICSILKQRCRNVKVYEDDKYIYAKIVGKGRLDERTVKIPTEEVVDINGLVIRYI